MRQTLSGILPKQTSGENVADLVGATNTPWAGWSQGASLTLPLQDGGPSVSQKWSLLSVSVQGYLVLAQPGVPLGGKFGKIIASLVMESPPPYTGAGGIPVPYVKPVQQIPNDSSLTVDLWDPANDALPPTLIGSSPTLSGNNSGIGGSLAISNSISPPVPLELNPGEPPSLQISMLPSILAAQQQVGFVFGLAMYYGTYTINYDDGL